MFPSDEQQNKGRRYPSRDELLARHAGDVDAGPFARTALDPPRFLSASISQSAATPAASSKSATPGAIAQPQVRGGAGERLWWLVAASTALLGLAGGVGFGLWLVGG